MLNIIDKVSQKGKGSQVTLVSKDTCTNRKVPKDTRKVFMLQSLNITIGKGGPIPVVTTLPNCLLIKTHNH